MIKETKKITHKLVVEGLFSINGDNSIEIDIPDRGVKQLHNLIRNFSGNYVKFTLQEEDQEDIEINEEDSEDGEDSEDEE